MKNRISFFPLLLFLFILVFMSSLIISFYFPFDQALSIGIIADLILTFPIFYLGVIWHTKIPKTTVVFVLFIGVLMGSFLLPKEEQIYLDAVKFYFIPIIEIIILAYLVYKVYKIQKTTPKTKHFDFYTQLLNITKQLFPERIAYFAASELSILYYCFFCWKAVVLRNSQFSYHRKNGSAALLWALIMLLIVETIVLHLIIELYSPLLAWILTILSIYTCFQVLSLIKSMQQRPIEVVDGKLWLKYGTLCDTQIPLSMILRVTDFDHSQQKEDIPRLSPLGELESPNLCLTFKETVVIRTAFGQKKTVNQLLVVIDEVEQFKKYLKNRLV